LSVLKETDVDVFVVPFLLISPMSTTEWSDSKNGSNVYAEMNEQFKSLRKFKS